MWLETGELVRLLEKVDDAAAQVNEYFGSGADAGAEEPVARIGAVLGELRKLIYADIARADADPPEVEAERASRRRPL